MGAFRISPSAHATAVATRAILGFDRGTLQPPVAPRIFSWCWITRDRSHRFLALDVLDAALRNHQQRRRGSFLPCGTAVYGLGVFICSSQTRELESYRHQSSLGDDEALCVETRAERQIFAQIEEEECTSFRDYPRDLWINRDNEVLSCSDSACYRVGENFPATDDGGSSSGGGGGTSVAVIAGSVTGGGALFLTLTILFCVLEKEAEANGEKDRDGRRLGHIPVHVHHCH